MTYNFREGVNNWKGRAMATYGPWLYSCKSPTSSIYVVNVDNIELRGTLLRDKMNGDFHVLYWQMVMNVNLLNIPQKLNKVVLFLRH